MCFFCRKFIFRAAACHVARRVDAPNRGAIHTGIRRILRAHQVHRSYRVLQPLLAARKCGPEPLRLQGLSRPCFFRGRVCLVPLFAAIESAKGPLLVRILPALRIRHDPSRLLDYRSLVDRVLRVAQLRPMEASGL